MGQSVVLLGTAWGLPWKLHPHTESFIGNLVRTRCGAPKSRKILIKKSNPTPLCLPPSLPTPKEKELGPHEGMLSLLIGYLNFLILKLFVIIFFLG